MFFHKINNARSRSNPRGQKDYRLTTLHEVVE
jgi:hypothetical protein